MRGLNLSQGLVFQTSSRDQVPLCELPLFDKKSSHRGQTLVSATCPTNCNWFGLKGLVPQGALPSNRLIGMCRWMGSHFHDWIDYNEVAFSIELLEWGRIFWDFGVRKFWQVASWVLKNIGRFAVQK